MTLVVEGGSGLIKNRGAGSNDVVLHDNCIQYK